MAGIFPNSGVPAAETSNTANVPTVNCAAELFHSTTRCQPRFDPAAANAVMSELLNAMACFDHDYDCNRLDNLCKTLQSVMNAYVQYGALRIELPNGNSRWFRENIVEAQNEIVTDSFVVGSATTEFNQIPGSNFSVTVDPGNASGGPPASVEAWYFGGYRQVEPNPDFSNGGGRISMRTQYSIDNGSNWFALDGGGDVLLAPTGGDHAPEFEFTRTKMFNNVVGPFQVVFRTVTNDNNLVAGTQFGNFRHTAILRTRVMEQI